MQSSVLNEVNESGGSEFTQNCRPLTPRAFMKTTTEVRASVCVCADDQPKTLWSAGLRACKQAAVATAGHALRVSRHVYEKARKLLSVALFANSVAKTTGRQRQTNAANYRRVSLFPAIVAHFKIFEFT